MIKSRSAHLLLRPKPDFGTKPCDPDNKGPYRDTFSPPSFKPLDRRYKKGGQNTKPMVL